ncbi:MAG: HAMP domain-containing protein [Propionibacteriales bacterium]|nr:HAMP domain-containing protein [Propionibacteriales bacterium]
MSRERAERGLSVRWRLTLVYTAVAAASAAVLLAGVYSLVSTDDVPFEVLPDDGSEPAPPISGRPLPLPRDELISWAVEETLEDLRQFSVLGLVLMVVVSLVVGWVFAGRALRPVHTITSRARRISADSLDERLRIQGPHDELREMAETFDSLLDRIEEAFRSERRLVATMSHELRTPLANQRTALDVALADPDADATDLRRVATIALQQSQRAERTVDALLTLARVRAGVEPAHPEPVVLHDLVATSVATARAGAGPELRWEVDLDPITVAADAELLARAVGNLLGNAIVHNLSGGEAGFVGVRLRARPGTATLEVTNSGPRLDPAAVEDLTLPFRRGADDRTASAAGTGLGLTIVREIADHHRGTLRMKARPEGGLEAALTVPAGP